MGDGMTAFISITESQVLTALGDFIVAILPAGVEVEFELSLLSGCLFAIAVLRTLCDSHKYLLSVS